MGGGGEGQPINASLVSTADVWTRRLWTAATAGQAERTRKEKQKREKRACLWGHPVGSAGALALDTPPPKVGLNSKP